MTTDVTAASAYALPIGQLAALVSGLAYTGGATIHARPLDVDEYEIAGVVASDSAGGIVELDPNLVKTLETILTGLKANLKPDLGCYSLSMNAGEILVSRSKPGSDISDCGAVIDMSTRDICLINFEGGLLATEVGTTKAAFEAALLAATASSGDIDPLTLVTLATGNMQPVPLERTEVREATSVDQEAIACIGDELDGATILFEMYSAPDQGRYTAVSRIETDEETGVPLRSLRAVYRVDGPASARCT